MVALPGPTRAASSPRTATAALLAVAVPTHWRGGAPGCRLPLATPLTCKPPSTSPAWLVRTSSSASAWAVIPRLAPLVGTWTISRLPLRSRPARRTRRPRQTRRPRRTRRQVHQTAPTRQPPRQPLALALAYGRWQPHCLALRYATPSPRTVTTSMSSLASIVASPLPNVCSATILSPTHGPISPPRLPVPSANRLLGPTSTASSTWSVVLTAVPS